MLSVMQCFLFKWENYALSLINLKEGSRGEAQGGNIDCTVAVLPSSEGIQVPSHAR